MRYIHLTLHFPRCCNRRVASLTSAADILADWDSYRDVAVEMEGRVEAVSEGVCDACLTQLETAALELVRLVEADRVGRKGRSLARPHKRNHDTAFSELE